MSEPAASPWRPCSIGWTRLSVDASGGRYDRRILKASGESLAPNHSEANSLDLLDDLLAFDLKIVALGGEGYFALAVERRLWRGLRSFQRRPP
jgi:hypothetical protein